MADGHLNKCKDCAKSDVRNNRLERLDYYSEYDRKRAMDEERVAAREAYLMTDAGRASKLRANRKWRQSDPLKPNAHLKVRRALLKGLLLKTPCVECGSTKNVQGHHPDYGKPLHVIWLCAKHHDDEHKRIDGGKPRYS